MKSDKARITKIWQNMMNGKTFIKGERDSTTQGYVLATRKGNYFGPDTCYFALVKNLPPGTIYVDEN